MMNRKIEELIFKEESAWLMIQDWLSKAENQIELLPNSRTQGEETLLKLQVTNKSTLGAIALECGGILIDNGWLRILGSGHSKISGNILSWNNIGSTQTEYSIKGAMIVGYDIVGGVFAINGGAFGNTVGNVFYFAPDTLDQEDTEKGYTDFIYWALNGDLNLYYESFRWGGWEEDTKKLTGNEGIFIYPYLWTKEGKNVEECHKKAIPMNEIWGVENEFIRQIM